MNFGNFIAPSPTSPVVSQRIRFMFLASGRSHTMITATPIYAGLLALLFLGLSYRVVQARVAG